MYRNLITNNMIKYIFAIICVFILFPVICSAQNNINKGLQWGAEIRYDSYLSQELTSGNVSLGWRFNRKNYAGIRAGIGRGNNYSDATGYHYDFTGIPIVADYTRYLPLGKKKKHSFYVGAEVGTVLQHYTDKIYIDDKENLSTNDSSPFISAKLGFDFAISKMHIQLGTQLNLLGFGCHLGLTF
jgi:hypothetical protein